MKNYTAPWSRSLIYMSVFATLICVTVAVTVAARGDVWLAVLPLAIVLGGLLLTIQSYTVTSEALLIRRLFWTTRLPLADLRSAQVDSRAMRWSVRTFGIGGLFSFSGWYYNRLLGSYRAFVTDPNRAVVLRLGRRNVVVSPCEPNAFVNDLLVTGHAL
ncbi:MAG TPA: PH domain-containing protein [Chthoniobacterales bacterium]